MNRLSLKLVSIFVVVAASARQPPVLQLETIKYFDKFGFEDTLIYDGGYLTVVCALPTGTKCVDRDDLKLIDSSKYSNVVADKPCPVGGDKVELRLKITDQTKLDQYRCLYNRTNSNETLDLDYRLCSAGGKTCVDTEGINTKTCGPLGKYCFIARGNKRSQCANVDSFDISLCKIHEHANVSLCPANVSSHCEALAKNALNRIDFQARFGDCDSFRDGYPHLLCGGKKVNYGGFCSLTLTTRSITVVSNSVTVDGTRLDCTINRGNGSKVQQNPFKNFSKEAKFDLDEAINEGLVLFKVKCTFWQNGIGIANLSTFLVVSGGIEKLQMDYADNNKALRCFLNPTPLPSDFKATFWWTREPKTKIHDGSMFYPKERGSYTCHAKVIFKSCSPHTKFEFFYNSGTLHNHSVLDSLIQQPQQSTAIKIDRPPVFGIIFAFAIIQG